MLNIKIKPMDYLNNVLVGSATAIVVVIVSTGIFVNIFDALSSFPVFSTLSYLMKKTTLLLPFIIGLFIARQFDLSVMRSALVGAVAFIAGGSISSIDETGAVFNITIIGVGDVMNVLLISLIAVIAIQLIGKRFGSYTIVLLPLIIVGGVGELGIFTLDYVKTITTSIGNGILHLQNLQPLLMCMLIAGCFSLIIISPISSVAIGMAVSLQGVGAGAAAIGVATCAIFMAIGSSRKNGVTFTISIILGTIKLLMPNFFKNPILAIPLFSSAMIAGAAGQLLDINGVAESAGFGLIGLIGPLESIKIAGISMASMLNAGLAFFVIPFIACFLIDLLCRKVFKLYSTEVFAEIKQSK